MSVDSIRCTVIAYMEFAESVCMIPKWIAMCGRRQARRTWALLGDMGKLSRGGLDWRAHRHAHRALMFSICSAAGADHGDAVR